MVLIIAMNTNRQLTESPLATKLANMSRPQLRKLADGKDRNLIELAPLVLPTPEHVVGANNHFGWPVATKTGKTIIVFYLRRRSHLPQPFFDEDSSGSMMVRSHDDGRTWTEPLDLREIRPRDEDGKLPPYAKGECVGATRNGVVVFGTADGTYRSEDRGQTWEFLPHPFDRDLEDGRHTTHNCPKFIEHPEHGLMRCAPIKEGPTMPDFADELHVACSKDGGRTWDEARHEIPSIAKPAEPSTILHEGAMIMIGRCHSKKPPGHDPRARTTAYVQMWSESGWFPVQAKITNMLTTDRQMGRGVMSSGYGLDTVDLSYNPVSKRLEVVATNRSGGGEGRYWKAKFSLNLWSIDPGALVAGSAEWRFEGSFFERRTAMGMHGPRSYGRYMDGCHPAGAVIDEELGVQHVFIYMGCMQGPSGIFRLTRTLDTEKLRRFLLS